MIPNSFSARIFALVFTFRFLRIWGCGSGSQEIAAFWEGDVVTFRLGDLYFSINGNNPIRCLSGSLFKKFGDAINLC
jgi:hypothetical protein